MGLFEDICSYQNLRLAFERVEDNAGTCGIDNVTIEEFSLDLEKRLIFLRRHLLDGTYVPDALLKVGMPEDNGKIRWLSIPTVRDRVVQTSAAMVLSPFLDREFEDCSFAYRKDRSVQKAIRRIIELRGKGYTWVVDADITAFFDEINHTLLLKEVAKYISDGRVIDLINKWLTAEVVYQGKRTRLAKGIPQGSPISPLLSNLYLDSFDEALMQGKLNHVRFADDFVILCKDRPDAEDALELTGEVLGKLKLNLNADKTRLVHFNQGFRFLGVEFLRSMVYRPLYEDNDLSMEVAIPAKKGPPIENTRARADASDPRSEPHKVSSPSSSAIGDEANAGKDGAVHKPIPEKEQRGPAKETVPRSLKKEHDHRLPGMPDSVMAQAFREAFSDLDQPEIDTFFQEKPEIEPSSSGETFLRTLYLLEQGVTLAKEDERFKVIREGEVIREIPVIKVDQVIVFGNIQITTQAMKFCLAEDIPVILLSSTGKYFGAIASFKRVNIVLQKRQFDMVDDGQKALEIAKAIVRAKVTNEKVILQRYVRKRRHLSLDAEIRQMNALMDKISQAQSREEIMGIEDAAAARYFSSIRTLLEGKWRFERRQKQPPPDPVNSLLSYGYTLLFYNIFRLSQRMASTPMWASCTG